MSKPINRVRTKQINVYLFEEELQLLETKSKEAGVSKSEYIRNVIIFGSSQRNTNFSEEEAEKLIYEVGKIGNNINQIARYVNMQKSVDGVDMNNLIEEFGELQRLIAEVCLE